MAELHLTRRFGAARPAAIHSLLCAAIAFGMLAYYKPLPHVDLYPTYVAARLANEGRWGHIYHASIWLHGSVDPEWDARANEFVYHPWYLNAARPLAARMTYETFQQFWVWISKGSLVAAGLSMALLMRWRRLEHQLLLTLLVALSPTTLYGINLGQNVLPALVFSLAAALAWQSGASLAIGGGFAALAWMFKPWCAALLPLCWLLRGVRAGALSSAALLALMVALPELLMPRELMQDYHAMNLALAESSTLAWNNLSVQAIVERFAKPDWSQQLGVFGAQTAALSHRALALLAVAAIVLSALLIWLRRRPAPAATSAAWLALMLLPVSVCWIHYFIFALPVACLVAFSGGMPWLARLSGAALLALVPSLEALYGLTPAEYLAYQTHPAGLPWLRMLPMALVACTSLSALRYARRAPQKAPAADLAAPGRSERSRLRAE